MALSLSSWLATARSVQIFLAVAGAAMNGFLVAIIYLRRLGSPFKMVMLEWMVCMLLVYTVVALVVQHTGKRTSTKKWLVPFIVLDTMFCGLSLAIITVLAVSGVPRNCGGLVKASTERSDKGYSTVFSDGSGKGPGELDKWCSMERGFYVAAFGLVLLYLATVALQAARIVASRFEALGLYEGSWRASDLQQKLAEGGRSWSNIAAGKQPAQYPQQHSQRPSISSPILENSPDQPGYQPHLHSSSSPATTPRHTSNSAVFAGPRASTPSAAAAADGFAGPTVGPVPSRAASNSGSIPIILVDHSRNHHQNYHRQHQHYQAAVPPLRRRDTVESEADAAIIADGSRGGPSNRRSYRSNSGGGGSSHPHIDFDSSGFGAPLLPLSPISSTFTGGSFGPPAYEPARGPGMEGHSDGDGNEMRLSGYIKGETRAQGMKDRGEGF